MRSCVQSRHPAQRPGNKPVDGPKGKGKEKRKQKRKKIKTKNNDPPHRGAGGGRGLGGKPQRNSASQVAQSQPAQTLLPQHYVCTPLTLPNAKAHFPLRVTRRDVFPAAPQRLVAQQGAGVTGRVQQQTRGWSPREGAQQDRSSDHRYASSLCVSSPVFALAVPVPTLCASPTSLPRAAQLSQAPNTGRRLEYSSCRVCQATSQSPSQKEHIFLLTSQSNSLF